MSVADTSDYAYETMAREMTDAVSQAEDSGWRSPEYKAGFLAAFEVLSKELGIKIHNVPTYEYE